MKINLYKIAECFRLKGKVKSIKPLGEGFINDTYLVNTEEEEDDDYLMQRKNKNIFTNIPAMMDNIEKVSAHLKEKVKNQGGDPMQEAMTIIRTFKNELYHIDENGDFWTICLFIPNSVTYECADTPELAFAGGKGIGKFQRMTSDFEGELTDILPGFHNIRFRFNQWDEVLEADPVNRKKEVQTEIAWIEERREEMLKFWSLVEKGTIPARITHNDTKISNILFDKENEVLCVIDLDTVLRSTVLNDFGDAIRSYTNTGLEDDNNLQNVSMSMELFKAYSKGYLSETKSFLTSVEIEHLAFSAKYITYEQVLRFLMDYIDGDKYYKTKSKNHNLLRARAQFKLLQSIEDQLITMEDFVSTLA